MTSTAENERPVILFDGVCNLCTGSVQFVIARDSRKRFRFASLQSAVAEKLLSLWRRDAWVESVAEQLCLQSTLRPRGRPAKEGVPDPFSEKRVLTPF